MEVGERLAMGMEQGHESALRVQLLPKRRPVTSESLQWASILQQGMWCCMLVAGEQSGC